MAANNSSQCCLPLLLKRQSFASSWFGPGLVTGFPQQNPVLNFHSVGKWRNTSQHYWVMASEKEGPSQAPGFPGRRVRHQTCEWKHPGAHGPHQAPHGQHHMEQSCAVPQVPIGIPNHSNRIISNKRNVLNPTSNPLSSLSRTLSALLFSSTLCQPFFPKLFLLWCLGHQLFGWLPFPLPHMNHSLFPLLLFIGRLGTQNNKNKKQKIHSSMVLSFLLLLFNNPNPFNDFLYFCQNHTNLFGVVSPSNGMK